MELVSYRVHRDVLADGREIIYIDDPHTSLGSPRRVDSRTLAARPETATMRQDPLTGEWVSHAAARQNRLAWAVLLAPAMVNSWSIRSISSPSTTGRTGFRPPVS